MPRRRPFSAKQKKEQVQAKRARKRGEDIPAPTRRPPSNSTKKVTPRVALESRFVTLPPGFLDRTRDAAKEFVLVLTKADLVDSAALEGWRAWLKEWWGGEAQVVCVTSYDLGLMYADKRRHKPAIPSASRKALVDALREAHGRLLAPPEWARTDERKLAAWRPSVRSVVDWDVLAAGPAPPARGNGKRGTPREGSEPEDAVEEEEEEEEEEEHDKETDERPTRDHEVEPLTIGLIGQPNVGKSSLLNALLGTNRVRASKTPGKTKHFQTIFWASEQVKIVDCPGLVCPSPAPMELQAMAGILPISQIPSLPACTAFVARHMPLEDIFRVPRPKQEDDIDLRTWRGPRPTTPKKKAGWTAGEIMDARALDRGFLTAKGGRPDANRAANGSE
ncbi:hypothetical protein CspHIS471_0107350 [Cutaneotrichosporon sp. HIS471]|nr:hypothetical protein CspHIS471_0107350 [Cutaneotrichosporon sp. HIS471]